MIGERLLFKWTRTMQKVGVKCMETAFETCFLLLTINPKDDLRAANNCRSSDNV